MSNHKNISKRGRYKQKCSTKKSAGKPIKAAGPPASSRVHFTSTSTHELMVGGRKLPVALSHLKRSGLRHYVTDFLKGGIRLCVFINPFSVSEREDFRAIKSFITDG